MRRCSLQDVFSQHFDSFAARRMLHPRESRAAWCIRHCFTPSCGAHLLRCPAGHFEQLQLHACRHRSCPRCAARPRQLWLQAQLQRLLPCPHFHVVFTLPHVLLPLWRCNRSRMAALLLDCARDVLLQLMADPARCGVRPGLMLALHTWGRNLSLHPHVHCTLSAGGITPEGLWKPASSTFLLPLAPLQHLWRGKLLARLKALLVAQRLALPPEFAMPHWLHCIRTLYRAHWNVHIQRPYGHARGLALYLARYVKGGPVPADRALRLAGNGLVRMPYTDHRDGRTKTLCLPAHDFIERVLCHAPPARTHQIRYAGLYASAHAAHHHAARLHILAAGLPRTAPAPTAQAPISNATAPTAEAPRCPQCNATLLLHRMPARMHPRSAISPAATDYPATAVPPGPTRRSNGQLTAGRSGAPPPQGIVGSAPQRPAVSCRSTKR
jgi:hypothetical protein